MPSVNLRLSDEQHAELVAAGKRSNRSLQREMIYRMFGRSAPAGDRETPISRKANESVQADSQARDVQSRTIAVPPVQDTFKPDPKPERKKK